MDKSTKVKLFLLDNLIWVLVVVFFLVNAVMTPKFASVSNITNIFYHMSVLSMLVLGAGLTFVIGQMDLSLESTTAFAPAVAAVVATKVFPGMNPVLTVFLTIAVGAVVGLFNGFLVSKVGVNAFLQTLSVNIILRGLAIFLVPYSITQLGDAYLWLGSGRVGNIMVAVIAIFIIFLVFQYIMKYTRFGREFISTGGNKQASYIAGINTSRITIWGFVLSGALAAMAGLLAAGRAGSVSNNMGKDMNMMAFAGAILGGASLDGGVGMPLGMLGGAILLQMVSNSLTLLGVDVNLVYACKGVIIFVALLLDHYKADMRSRMLMSRQIKAVKG